MQTKVQSLQLRGTDISFSSKSPRLRDYIDRKPNYFFCKRIFDIVFSSVVIIFILSWVVPVLALIIKIESRGPVFFRQKRVGRGGKIFHCIKFRTMKVNSEADVQQALENDNRITAFGKFLRIS